MTEFFTRAHYQESAAYIRSRTKHQPKIALVLGSGFGELADAVQNADIISSKGYSALAAIYCGRA